MNEPLLWDTHTHLTDPRLEKDWKVVLDDALSVGVHGVINIGIDPETSRKALEQACQAPDRMRVTVGLHPHEANRLTPEMLGELKRIARGNLVSAVGEIGLDYHYQHSSRTEQLRACERQVEMAAELDLPIVLHSRNAEDDVVSLLEGMRDTLRGGVLHCYTGGTREAGRALDLGLYLSFTGIITFSGGAMDELVRFVPLERLLLETDSPYLAPVPHRGKVNTPAYLPIVAEKIASLKEIGLKEVVTTTSRNAKDLFGL